VEEQEKKLRLKLKVIRNQKAARLPAFLDYAYATVSYEHFGEQHCFGHIYSWLSALGLRERACCGGRHK